MFDPIIAEAHEMPGIVRKINKCLGSFSESVQNIETKVDQTLSNLETQTANKINKALTEVQATKSEIQNLVASSDIKANSLLREYEMKCDATAVKLCNTIAALDKKYSKIHFDIIHNEDNIAITYMNSDGKVEYGAIEKLKVDNTTIKNENGILKLGYSLDSSNFNISTAGKVSVVGLTTDDGVYVSSNDIIKKLDTTSHAVQNLSTRIDGLVSQFSTAGGYTAANNFKMPNPTETQLTNYVINCMSKGSHKITKAQIPNGTKIKNLFDNHIWVLNAISIQGLTYHTWEDIGADTICTATNTGIRGLVTGSEEPFRGFIDINGVISINGLEEMLTDIVGTLSELKTKQVELEKQLVSKTD